MSDEFKFPKLVIHEEYEREGKKFSRAVTSPVCDFCFDERVMWSYECDDYVLETSVGPWASHNGWAACSACSDLVEARLWNDLAVRVLHSWDALGAKPDGPKISDASLIVFGFADHYTPGRVAFG